MGIKISELQEKTTANDTDIIPIVDTGTKKITKANLLKEITEALANFGIYSTEEVYTGERWIDGKKIYRKVFVFTTTSNNSERTVKEIDISDLKIETLIEGRGVLKSNSNNIYNAERCEGEDSFTRFESTTSYKKLTYHTKGNNNYFAGTVIFTIRYTKTTD